MQATTQRAGVLGVSANRIKAIRDRGDHGVAERCCILMEGLNQPRGMPLVGETYYAAISMER